MIELDGSYAEGGGQILRTALGLSALTGKAFRLSNIRKGRDTPGLRPQHVACVKACSELCNALVIGNKEGSTEIEFVPRELKNRQMRISIGTAGSVSLLFQSLMIPILFTENTITLSGGTDVSWSMPIDYVIDVLLPVLRELCEIDIRIEKRGYYPKGGGSVVIRTKPKYKRLSFDSFSKLHQYIFGNPVISRKQTGKVVNIKGVSHASRDLQDRKVAERQAETARLVLSSIAPVDIRCEYPETASTGSGIVLYSVYAHPEGQSRVGVDVLGEQRVKSEEVGRVAGERMLELLSREIPVDDHLQDNIIPFLGLFGGRVKTGHLTDHTKANIMVCEKFLEMSYDIEDVNDASFISVLSSSNP